MIDDRPYPAKINIGLLIMSLGLAIGLWAIVTIQETTTTREVYVSLQCDGLPSKYILEKAAPSEQSIKIAGPAELLKTLAAKSFKGYVDLSAAKLGTHAFTIGLPPELRDIAVPNGFPKINLTIDAVVPIDKVVQTQISGRLRDASLTLGDRYVSPHTVRITGPKSSVEQVAAARVTINLNDVRPDNPDVDGYIYLYNKDEKQLNERDLNLSVQPPNCQVHLAFSAAPVHKPAFVIAVFKGRPNSGFRVDGNYTVDPDKVTITGTSMALAQTASVNTEDIDLTGLTSSHQFVVKLILPPGVAAAEPKLVKVRVPIGPIQKPAR